MTKAFPQGRTGSAATTHRVYALAMALVVGTSFAPLASAAPQAFFFRAKYDFAKQVPNGTDTVNPPRTAAAMWNAAVNAPLEGVFIYDPAAAVNVTGTYVTPGNPAERDYVFPSPNTDAASANNLGLSPGLTQMNYLTSNGKTFRWQADTAGGGNNTPVLMKVSNNIFQPFGPPADLLPVFGETSDYWDVVEFRFALNVDPVNGPRARTANLLFIDARSGGYGPGTKASSLPGLDTDGTTSTVPNSLALNEMPLGPGALWAFQEDGNGSFINPADGSLPGQTIRHIAFGDADGNGTVNAADFAALVANYNKPAGTYQVNPGYSDAYTTETDWLGTAIWKHGDFNLDGLVNLQDYQVLLNPSLMSPGAPLTVIPGDVNFDGIVNLVDVQVSGGNWQNTTNPTGDANGDGIVNLVDIQVIGGHWQQTSPGAASAVPEPTSAMLAALAALAGCARFRKRNRRLDPLAACTG